MKAWLRVEERGHSRHGRLQQLDLRQQHVEAEQRDGGASPDHGGGFPGERTDEFLLAAEGDHERRMIRAFHQYDGRIEIEVESWRKIGWSLRLARLHFVRV